MSNYEDFHLKNLREHRETTLGLLRKARARLVRRKGRTALCAALIDSARAHSHVEAVLAWDLACVIRSRLGGSSWLEAWLHRVHGRPMAAGADGFSILPDPVLLPTRLAWIDSLIEEVSK